MVRMMSRTPVMLGVILLICLFGCTRQSQKKSSIAIRVPSASEKMQISESVSSMSVNGWGRSAPTAIGDINCYMVMVEASDLTGNVCRDAGGTLLASPGMAVGLVPASGVINAEVTAGANRTIYLLGFKAGSSADCVGYNSTVFSRSSFSQPMILGAKTLTLSPGDVNVTMTASIQAGKQIKSCSGPAFSSEWNAGASPTFDDISLVNSTIAISPSMLTAGGTATVTLTTRDGSGQAIAVSGLSISPGLSGGTSSGTFSAFTNNGDGTYTATFTATASGSAASLTATLDGSALMSSPASVTVTTGSISLAQSTISLSSASVASGSTVTATVQAKDAGGNTITTGGASVVFSLQASGGLSTGNWASGGTATDNGDGTYTCVFTGVLAGAAAQVYATVGGSAVTSASPTVTVTAGAPDHLEITGPSTLTAGACGTYTATVKDVAGNTANATANYGGVVSGGSAGTIWNGAACTGSPSLSIASGTSSKTFYYKNPDAESVTLTATAAGDGITGVGFPVSITGTYGWMGFSVSLQVEGAGGDPVGGKSDASFFLPSHVHFDSAGNMYVMDYKNFRIVKINSGGTLVGWIGKVGALTPTAGASGCTSLTSGQITPGWCLGGSTLQGTSAGDGGISTGWGLTDDGTYLYVTDSDYGRVQRYNLSTGAFAGWIGKISTVPPSGGCSSAAVGDAAPTWCLGGTSSNTGTADGHMQYPRGVTYSGGNLYVVDANGNRIMRFTASTGAFTGWLGEVGTSPSGGTGTCNGAVTGTLAPGWCLGGTAQTTSQGFTYPGDLIVYSGSIYMSDTMAHRIVKLDETTGAFIGWIGYIGNATGLGGGAGCSSASASSFTPNWCTGGTPANDSTSGAGFQAPRGLTTDGTYLYVVDAYNNKINRHNLSDGAFQGRIGRNFSGCTLIAGWCSGTSIKSYTDGGFDFAPAGSSWQSGAGIRYRNGYLYVVNPGSHRVEKIDPTTPGLVAWTGGLMTASGWNSSQLFHGNSGARAAALNINGIVPAVPGFLSAPFGGGVGIGGSYLIVADTGNGAVKRYLRTGSGGYWDWTGARADQPVGGASGCSSLGANLPAPGWCVGGSSNNSGLSVMGAFNGPTGVAVYGNYAYIADSQNNRVQRLDLTVGAVDGWIGRVATTPSGGYAGCNATSPNNSTPGWCTGGTASAGTGDGAFNSPRGVATDGTYLFVADSTNNRIQKFNLSTGAFIGWTGGVSSNPTGGGASCTSAGPGSATPGWCTGGLSTSGTADGFYTSPNALAVSGSTLYILSSGKLSKLDTATGTFSGWMGRISNVTGLGGAAGCSSASNASFTPGWCTGGAAAASATPEGSFSAAVYNIAIYGNFLYTADATAHRILKYNLTSGTYAGWQGYINTPPTAGDPGCSSAAAGSFTPGWCTGGTATAASGMGFNQPLGLAVDPFYIYISDSNNGRIVRLPAP